MVPFISSLEFLMDGWFPFCYINVLQLKWLLHLKMELFVDSSNISSWSSSYWTEWPSLFYIHLQNLVFIDLFTQVTFSDLISHFVFHYLYVVKQILERIQTLTSTSIAHCTTPALLLSGQPEACQLEAAAKSYGTTARRISRAGQRGPGNILVIVKVH